MSNPCQLYPHCQIGLSAVVGCRARFLQNSGDVVLVSEPEQEISGVTKLVDQRTFCTVSCTIPSGLVASCWPVLPGVWSESILVEMLILMHRRYARIGGRGILPGLLVYVWKVSDSTVDSAVAILFVATYVRACRTLRTGIGVAWRAELYPFPACQQLKTSQGRSQPRGKAVKTIKQRLWPNAGVAGRLAKSLFAARLCVYRTQYGQAHSVCWMEELLPL